MNGWDSRGVPAFFSRYIYHAVLGHNTGLLGKADVDAPVYWETEQSLLPLPYGGSSKS